MEDKPGPSKPIICGQNKLTENYFRLCGLITTLCSEIFRITLSSYIKPGKLRSVLDRDRTKLEKIMNVSQKEQVYKTPGNALSTKDFDISLLYILLRNICGIPQHKKGWGNPPDNGDNSLAACIERIRIQRNLISAHSPNGKIEDVEFQKKWDELRNDITQIERHVTGGEGFKDSVDDLYKCKLNHDIEEKYQDDLKKSDDPEENMPPRLKKTPQCSTNKQLVAAIDFGTAYSGHAFSSRGDFKNDPLKITAHKWSRDLLTLKTPTCALFDGTKKLIAFGHDAEKTFGELSANGAHQEHYFFERFKMQLYEKNGDEEKKKLTDKTMIQDISGKELHAMYVFSKAIQYMQNHLLKELKDQDHDEISEEDINWVLTVPAIWDDSAKQFMRDAAEQAGIRSKNLTIALEPEAASMYCKKIQLVKLSEAKSDKEGFDIFSPGNQYLILDAGGGTVDITIHEVLTDDRIKELDKPTGGPWGGTYLDKEFFNILEECFGKDEFEKFKADDLSGYIELRKELEMKKRDIGSSTDKISLTVPPHLRSKCDTTRSEFAEYLICCARKDKLEFNESLIKKWYSKVCETIVDHVRYLLEKHKIETVLMVGGFSDSKFLQETMKKAFPNKTIVVPHDASLAVLKGAVLFGHNPSSIVSRVAKYTYGVNTSLPVEGGENVLDEKRIKIIGGVKYKTDVFSKHVTKGANLEFDKAQHEMVYLPLLTNQTTIRFRVYKSSIENPKYVDDPECRPLGYINVDIPDTSEGLDRKVRVRFIFGGTEIKVEGINEITGDVTSVKFDYYDCTEEGDRYLCKPGV